MMSRACAGACAANKACATLDASRAGNSSDIRSTAPITVKRSYKRRLPTARDAVSYNSVVRGAGNETAYAEQDHASDGRSDDPGPALGRESPPINHANPSHRVGRKRDRRADQ